MKKDKSGNFLLIDQSESLDLELYYINREPGNIDHAIAKWDFLATLSNTELDNLIGFASTSCSLCIAYSDGDNCLGCPLAIYTHRGGCERTPYGDFDSAVALGWYDVARRSARVMARILRRVKAKIEAGKIVPGPINFDELRG